MVTLLFFLRVNSFVSSRPFINFTAFSVHSISSLSFLCGVFRRAPVSIISGVGSSEPTRAFSLFVPVLSKLFYNKQILNL